MKRKLLILLLISLLSMSSGSVFAFESEVQPIKPKQVTSPWEKEISFLASASAEDELAYDSSPMWYFQDATEVGTLWAVRFTPAQSCSLVYCKILTYMAPGSMKLHVWANSGGLPGSDLITPTAISVDGSATYQTFNFAPPLDMGSNDFHLGVEYTQPPPPYTVADGDSGTGRSSFYEPGGTWETVHLYDFCIRAYVKYYGNDVTSPLIDHVPISMAFTDNGNYQIMADITDASGISSALIFYSLNGGSSYEQATMFPTGAGYVGYIPTQPKDTNVLYYIRAIDNSPNHNTTYDPPSGAGEPYSFLVESGYELGHDDNSYEDFFIVADYWENNKFAVKFTPSVYPVDVYMMRVLVNDTTSFQLSINSETGGQPGGVLAGPFWAQATSPDLPIWVNFIIPEPQRPKIFAGNFYVVLSWRSDSPEAPGVGSDENDPLLLSYFYLDSYGWILWEYSNWMIRGVVLLPTAVEDEDLNTSMLDGFSLKQNFPNPFNPETMISYDLPKEGFVRLEIFNILGQKVRTVVSEYQAAGTKSVIWDGKDHQGRNLPSGVYLYRLSAEGFTQTKQMVITK